MRSLVDVVRGLGQIKDEELKPLAAGFAGFLFALGGYFLLLPLRDEAGVLLGTDKLPRLFMASLFLTFLATPLASAFLNRLHARERGLQLLFRALALSVLGFMLLYLAADSHLDAAALADSEEHKQAVDDADTAGSVLLGARRQQDRRLLAAPGVVQLSSGQAAVRVAFFLWVSLLNLVTVSSLWARSADVFSPEAASRLFGLLGAGATVGQLLGSLAARALVRAPLLGGGSGSPSLLPLLAAAVALELAGQAAVRYRTVKTTGSGSPLAPDVVEAEAGEMVRQASSSSLAWHGSDSHLVRVAGKGGLGAAGGKGTLNCSGCGNGKAQAVKSRHMGAVVCSLLDQLLGRNLEGYHLIRASPYLMHICTYLALNYVTSSFFYFEKTLVVARVHDATSRTAWFATINSTSASFILGLQLLATGRVLRYLGLPIALGILPASAGLLMAGIALWPVPSLVAMAEVLRKILSYSLARPARESLFTVIRGEEKYKAKIFLDTVVQRIGDTLAAVAFQAFQAPALGFGASGMAAACMLVCALWSVVAYRLGQHQQRLAGGSAESLVA